MKFSSNLSLVAVLAAVVVVAVVSYIVLNPQPPENSVDVRVLYDFSCERCQSASPVINSLKNNGVPIGSWVEYSYNSTEGRGLIQKHAVEKVPVIIISKNVMDYEFPRQMFAGINLSEVSGSYLFYLNPPFRDLAEDRIAGLVDIFFLTDPTCAECYNVTIHGDVLAQDFKVVFDSALSFDINFLLGLEFIDRYNITAVPTYILTADAKYYPRLTKVWPSVGTVEATGYYVFRNVSQAGTYRNLTSGEIVNPLNRSV